MDVVMRLFPLLLVAATLLAQDRYPLESLRIRGNEVFSSERIATASGLKVGMPVALPDFNAARDRLMATGAFNSIGFEFKPSAAGTGYDGALRVVETSPLFHYRFEELPASDATLRAILHTQESIFNDEIAATPQVLNRYSAALARTLGNGAQVVGELNTDLAGDPMIVFRPLGERRNISEVRFQGNTTIDTPDLWKAINPVAVGTPYSEPFFRRILESSIGGLYEEEGRVRTTFSKIETSRATDNEGLIVNVTLDEGPAYKLGEVTYRGVPTQALSQLNSVARWTKGDRYRASANNEALARIRKHFREDGYLHVATEVEKTLDDAKQLVNLAVAITPGESFQMGKLTIVGLDILSEPAIRKLWRLPEGETYKEDYPEQFLAVIQSEGYFDNLARTSMAADLREDTHRVDVTLTFLGAKAAAEADRKRR
jgi:outer membrane protein assembly factor BamA